MAKNSSTDAVKRAAAKRRGERPGDVKINRRKQSPTARANTLNKQLEAQRKAECQQIVAAKEAREAERKALEEANRAAFVGRQLDFALKAPQIVNSRANGGLDGDAQAIAYLYVAAWGDITFAEADAASMNRVDLAINKANAQMRAELGDDAFKVQFNVRRVAKDHARQAIRYGFNKAKRSQ